MWNRNLLLKVKVSGNVEVGEKRVKEQYYQEVRDPKVKGKHKPIQNKHFEPVLVCCGFFLTVR